MVGKHAHHVALTAANSQYAPSQVAKGRYASVSEVVRAGLHLLIECDAAGTELPAPTVPPKRGEA